MLWKNRLFLSFLALYIFIGVVKGQEDILAFPASNSIPGLRNLQSGPQGFFRNVIASINLPNVQENRVEIELIYDVALTAGALRTFRFGVFDERVGRIVGSDSQFSAQVNGENARVIQATRTGDSITFQIDLNGSQEDDFSVSIFYKVDNLVCQHSDGEQAIAATWFNFITSTTTRQVEVDYTVPSQIFPPDFNPSFTPDTSAATVVRNDENITFFLPYNPDAIKFNAGDNTVSNMFLLLGRNVFPPQTVEDCKVLDQSNAYAVFVVGVIVVLCVCLVGGAIYQKFFESRVQQRRYRPRTRDLNVFPGNPDIILGPEGSGAQTTVRAVMESDDVSDFDNEVPVRTINVNLEAQRNNSERSLDSAP